jgi:FSR family fosmidomycin resistance protein-like MFS transporter
MASGLILGLAMGIGGVGTTVLGWVADQWGMVFSLKIVFILPFLSLFPFLFLPSSLQLQKNPSALPPK